ncbi:hypothetical protein C8J56DRAFT_1051188 [Mycena floridula]|nr:hypothetical protein C8J56DRAFT_1051188 [Mycena floridula]
MPNTRVWGVLWLLVAITYFAAGIIVGLIAFEESAAQQKSNSSHFLPVLGAKSGALSLSPASFVLLTIIATSGFLEIQGVWHWGLLSMISIPVSASLPAEVESRQCLCHLSVYHGLHDSDAGVYGSWEETAAIVGDMPFAKHCIFVKFLSAEQAQLSFSETSRCAVIEALKEPIPHDHYECWVVTRGATPGLYMLHKLFLSVGLAYGAGTFRYFSGPGTKNRTE